MQKKLIALAVAGLASTGAFAQSNVTVYGVADATFDVVKTSGNDSKNDLGNMTRVSSNSSYIGFKGAEALGNGLTAVFQVESGVDFAAGGNSLATRDTFVGVAGGFGTVVLGNLTGPTRALGGAVDVNSGATGIGTNGALLGKLGNYLTADKTGGNGANGDATLAACGRSSTCVSVFDQRWKNAIAYVSPTFYGLSGTFAYVANENKAFQGAPAANTTGFDAGLKYANGPLMAAVTYNAVSLGQGYTGSRNTDISDFRVGATYDFGVATVRALFDRARADHVGAVGGKVTQNVFGLGGTFNVTPAGKILAQAYLAQDLKVDGSSNGLNKDSGAKLFEVGYEHSLSKRTVLKAVYAHLNNDKNAYYDFGINSVGINAAGTATTGGAPAAGLSSTGATLQGIQLGLRHSF